MNSPIFKSLRVFSQQLGCMFHYKTRSYNYFDYCPSSKDWPITTNFALIRTNFADIRYSVLTGCTKRCKRECWCQFLGLFLLRSHPIHISLIRKSSKMNDSLIQVESVVSDYRIIYTANTSIIFLGSRYIPGLASWVWISCPVWLVADIVVD